MKINGFITAKSERLKLSSGDGTMLKVHNSCMNIIFYIFIPIDFLNSWKKVLVDQCYRFEGLKLNSFAINDDYHKVFFNASFETTFSEIEKCYHIFFPTKILKVLVKHFPLYNCSFENDSNSNLISYEGVITRIKDSMFGIYELDKKIMLYTTFIYNSDLISLLKEDCKIFVLNAHFFSGYQNRKILVCCGLSSIRLYNQSEIKVSEKCDLCPCTYLVYKYALSIFDVLWIEKLLTRLDSILPSASLDQCNVSIKDFKSLDSILKLFACTKCLSYINEITTRPCHAEEFLSCPHTCIAFSEHILNHGYFLPFIVDVINEAETRISYNQRSKNYRFDKVSSSSSSVLFGILFLTSSGSFYICDNQDCIACVFSGSCEEMPDAQCTVCSFQDLNTCYLIALKEYEIVFEEILHNNAVFNHECYLHISWSSVCLITSFPKKSNLSSFTSPTKPDDLSPKACNEYKFNDKSYLHIDRVLDICDVDMKNSSNFKNSCSSSNYYKQFVVVSKMWSSSKSYSQCSQALVIFMDDTMDAHSCNQNCDSYTEEDVAFAYLIDKMEGLDLRSKSRLVLLCFSESNLGGIHLETGHIYNILLHDFKSIKNCNYSYDILKVSKDMCIHPSFACKGRCSPEKYGALDYMNIQTVLTKRNVMKNGVVRGVITEKFYEGDHKNPSKSTLELKQKMTLCLILEDITSKDSIRVYIAHYPQRLYGLLPGVIIELFGFTCICSQRNYLYLRPSHTFGIGVIDRKNTHQNIRYFEYKPTVEQISSSKIIQLENFYKFDLNVVYKCLCNVLKILSVEMFLSCRNCENILEGCHCSSSFAVRAKASFLVDDGTDQAYVHCDEENLQKILKINDWEWKQLLSCIENTKQTMKFNHKMDESELISISCENQVFFVLCSSHLLLRKVVLFFYPLSQKGNPQKSCWCVSVEEPNTNKLTKELYAQVLDV